METLSLVLILFCASFVRVSVRGQSYGYEHIYASTTKQYTRQITLKQGVLQGIVVEPRVNHALPPVEQYLGIPYAAPPVGELRFMPPGSSPSWFGVKYADQMGPVCPQKFPNKTTMEDSRKKYFERLVKYLLNQSEDCLYLNIYAPLQDINKPHSKKHPVMVFIHGESFEWNSGNPYDGSVLASYGKVIVVTLNYRLGILGFLKVGLDDNSRSNFGLVDQVAALLWVQENIAAFGGDPNSVTLFGHGTGAACISLLMLSPMVVRGEKPLFHRAILMSGTALSDWALASTSRQVTYQVAESLNCPSDEKLAACLRKKNLKDIMEVGATTRDYMTRFGPIVDGLVVPNDPNKIMSSYNDFFRRFELMYGLTEVESVHLLNPVSLAYGLLEKERDQELRKYLYTRCEYKPELYLAHALEEYTRTERMGLGEQMQAGFTGHEPDRASVARDTLLDMLSDARSAAPIALTAKYHSAVNPQSYFYIFGHTTASRDFIRNKTTHGEELPYVFGAPLDGPKFHFTDHYNNQERLFSEVVMKLWCNFAFSGDPNIKRRNDYLTLNPLEWMKYETPWPEYDTTYERYLYLAIPIDVRSHYRSKEIYFWNVVLPSLLINHTNLNAYTKPSPKPSNFPHFMKSPPKSIPPWFSFGRGTSTDRLKKPLEKKPSNDVTFGTVKLRAEDVPLAPNKPEFGTIITSPTQTKSGGTAMIVLIAVGGIFLLINVILFVGLYYKCSKLKHTSNHQNSFDNPLEESTEKQMQIDENGCSLMKIISKSSRSGDTYEAVKISEDGSSKYKLSRQISASTIDPHTKVRDWIAQEIVQKCSPKFLRRSKNVSNLNKETNSSDTSKSRKEVKSVSLSTLGKSPTRPVSTVDNDDSNIPQVKTKVSVAVDATPAARSPSVLRQQPIELTKSLDFPHEDSREIPLRRSATLDNFLEGNLSVQCEPTVVKIEHHHMKSKSEPAKDSNGDPIYACPTKNLKSFDPNYEINVTSKNENEIIQALTPEESLQTIKRRNFPKVLPDYPDKEYLANKRRSMPASSYIYATLSLDCKPHNKQPPPPPPRVCSTLGRRVNLSPLQQPAIMAKEPPLPEEPEITCNNLYVGSLSPRNRENILNTQPIYDNLRRANEETKITKRADTIPKTIITADPCNPIIKNDSKIIIKANPNKTEVKSNVTRVVASDNVSTGTNKNEEKIKHVEVNSSENMVDSKGPADIVTDDDSDISKPVKCKTPSQIPKLIKTPSIGNILSKGSSSESTPSDDSETGTIIKRV